jgi:hypothetical protein
MKRMVIGSVLLISLLVGGALSSRAMVQWHAPLEETLCQAAEFACTENWEQAKYLRRKAQESWESRWHMAAAFADHGPMEEIDSLFAQLEIYEAYQEPMGYSALCMELSRELGAMGDAHIPNWWNLL